MTKRAVLYARVSSDDRQNERRNLEGQLDMCRDHAYGKGWQIVAELSEDDSGASGATFELPMLNRVREMAQAKLFDILVVREIDRLSRRLAKQLVVEAELKQNGVQIEYVIGDYPDTPEGNFMKHVRATVAEFEREKINERMIRGRRQKVKSGSVVACGRIAYGYEPVEDNKQTTLAIREDEAKIIRLIFHWYTQKPNEGERLSIKAIARKLTELGVPTYGDLHGEKVWKKRGKGHWSAGSVSRILANKTYMGIWEYGKTSLQESLAVEVPTIVSPQIWQAAQDRRAKNKLRSKRNRKHRYLLSGHIRCSKCGRSATGQTFYPEGKPYGYYVCLNKRSPKEYDGKCDMPNFRVEQVDTAVWNWVKAFLSDPDKIATGFARYEAEQRSVNTPLVQRLDIIQGLLDKNQEQLERLIDLYLSDEFPRELLTERKGRLQATINKLEAEKQEVLKDLEAKTIDIEQLRDLQKLMDEIRVGLADADEDFTLKRHILDLLDVQVRLASEEGEKGLYISCILNNDSFDSENTAIYGSCQYKSQLLCW